MGPHQQQLPANPPVLFDELIVEIMSRVSVKSLIRFKCVCKYWNTLISSPSFIKLHLQRSIENSNLDNLRIMLKSYVTDFRELYQISLSVRFLFDLTMPTIVHDLRYRLTDKYVAVGSCHGLLCVVSINLIRHFRHMFRENPTGYLWNLATGLRSQELPCFHVDWRRLVYTRFGFGYDTVNKTYKVVAVHYVNDSQQSQKPEVEIYSMDDTYWRKISNFPNVVINNDGGVYLNGVLNWSTTRDSSKGQVIIVSFHLGNQTCRQILMPPIITNDVEPTLVVFKDHLCVWQSYNETYLVIWQMKDHGLQQSWTQLMKINYIDIQIGGLELVAFMPLHMFRNGDTLMLSRSVDAQWVMIRWNQRNGILEHYRIRTNGYVNDICPKLFIESLVLPY